MSRRSRKNPIPSKRPARKKAPVTKSIYDAVADGREYESIVAAGILQFDATKDIRRAIADIQDIRKRPLIIYAGNTVNSTAGSLTGITTDDDLPFAEMIAKVPSGSDLDIFVVTPGGLANQVAQFVDATRKKFVNVSFFVPHIAMSAGTIWVLSGNEIWMDDRARLGPIDPQVIGKNGQFLPLQSLQVLVDEIQRKGDEALKQKRQPNWTDVHLLQNIDAKELGYSISASNYSIQLASTYLKKHKFRDWDARSNGDAVDDSYKTKRANEIASLLCSHSHWKAHSHGISRDVAWNEVNLKISHPESIPSLSEAVRRLWAIMYFMFQSTPIFKMFISEQYALLRQVQRQANQAGA